MTLHCDRPESERIQTISDSVQMALKNMTEGDIAEFGVGYGMSLEAIAATLNYCERRDKMESLAPMRGKTVHAFDSFEGLAASTLPGDVDSPMVEQGV
jgi:hypothetical protein